MSEEESPGTAILPSTVAEGYNDIALSVAQRPALATKALVARIAKTATSSADGDIREAAHRALACIIALRPDLADAQLAGGLVQSLNTPKVIIERYR
jgi:hypothetical protein